MLRQEFHSAKKVLSTSTHFHPFSQVNNVLQKYSMNSTKGNSSNGFTFPLPPSLHFPVPAFFSSTLKIFPLSSYKHCSGGVFFRTVRARLLQSVGLGGGGGGGGRCISVFIALHFTFPLAQVPPFWLIGTVAWKVSPSTSRHQRLAVTCVYPWA